MDSRKEYITRTFEAVELTRESIPKAKWERFKMNEVQLRAHLAGLSCVMDEVFIISTDYSFCVYAISHDMMPVVKFFKTFQVDKQLKFYTSTPATMNKLLTNSKILNHGNVAVNPNSTIEQSYHIAKEAGSIGLVLDHVLGSLIKDKKQLSENSYTGIDTSLLNLKTFNNGYFYCQS